MAKATQSGCINSLLGPPRGFLEIRSWQLISDGPHQFHFGISTFENIVPGRQNLTHIGLLNSLINFQILKLANAAASCSWCLCWHGGKSNATGLAGPFHHLPDLYLPCQIQFGMGGELYPIEQLNSFQFCKDFRHPVCCLWMGRGTWWALHSTSEESEAERTRWLTHDHRSCMWRKLCIPRFQFKDLLISQYSIFWFVKL